MLFKKNFLKLKYAVYNFWSRTNKWFPSDNVEGLKQKRYHSYEDYLKHQKSKLEIINDLTMDRYEKKYFTSLAKRLKASHKIRPGSKVLCLAARLGTEVRVFNKLNCFSVAIDLNPGKENQHVVYGDFHNLPWKNGVVDIVFSNSIDHAFDLDKLMSEITRILNKDGLLILEIVKGEKEGAKMGYWESMAWDSIENVAKIIISKGFKSIYQIDFTSPWRGKHIIFKKT